MLSFSIFLEHIFIYMERLTSMFMGKYVDFRLPECSTQEELGSTLIEHLTVNRIKAKKPCFLYLTGESGEGKSYTGLAIEKIIVEAYDLDYADVMDPAIVYTPLEYSLKLRNLLYAKELKKLHVIMIDEARDLLSSKTWYDFINRTINDINNQHRGVKPLVVIVISQDLGDIDYATRKTIQYRGKCFRPIGKNAVLRLKRFWKDESDVSNVKLRERSLRGFLSHNGVSQKVYIGDIRVKLPPKNIRDLYDVHSFSKKSDVLRRKIEQIEKRIQKEMYGNYDKVGMLVDYYTQNQLLTKFVTVRKGKNFHIRDDFKHIHDLTGSELKDFEERYLERLPLE
jgi:hypothetical protein